MGSHIAKNNADEIKGIVTSYFYDKYTSARNWSGKIKLLHALNTESIIKMTTAVHNEYQEKMQKEHLGEIVELIAQNKNYHDAQKTDSFIINNELRIAFGPDAYLANDCTPIDISFKESEGRYDETMSPEYKPDKKDFRAMLFEIYAAQKILNKRPSRYIKVFVRPHNIREIAIKEYKLTMVEEALGPIRTIEQYHLREIWEEEKIYNTQYETRK